MAMMLDIDAEIARLNHEIEERQAELAVLQRFRARNAGADKMRVESSGSAPTNGARKLFSPKGTISGRNAAIQFLRKAGQPLSTTDIHRGAQELGAQVTYGSMHVILSEAAKKGKEIVKSPQRGFFGLKEWEARPLLPRTPSASRGF